MPSIDSLVTKNTKFLRREDLGPDPESGLDLIIKGFSFHEVVDQKTQQTSEVLCVEWTDQNFKPMIVKTENAGRLKLALKTDDTDEMIGRAVNVHLDPHVSMGGKLVGGLRIRAAKNTAQAPARAKPRPPVKPSTPYHDPDPDTGPPTPPAEAYEQDDEPPWRG